MTSQIFENRTLIRLSLMQRLLGQFPEENALIELNNLFASKPIESITQNEVTQIEDKYRLSLIKTFRLNLEEFYAVVLNQLITPTGLTHENLSTLEHLRTLLNIPKEATTFFHTRLGERFYQDSYTNAITNGRIGTEQQTLLNHLKDSIGLPVDVTDRIARETKDTYFGKFVSRIIADARVNPQEEAQLSEVINNLGIELDSAMHSQIKRYKLYWDIDNSPLPVVGVDVALQRGEVCHFQAHHVEWYEERATDRSTNYDDYFLWSQTLEEVDLEKDSATPRTAWFHILKRIDKGSLYLTNKRVIFNGTKKLSTFKLDGITNVHAFTTGSMVQRSVGKDPLFIFNKDFDVFTLLLRQIISGVR